MITVKHKTFKVHCNHKNYNNEIKLKMKRAKTTKQNTKSEKKKMCKKKCYETVDTSSLH